MGRDKADISVPSVILGVMENGEFVASILWYPLTGRCVYSSNNFGTFVDGEHIVISQLSTPHLSNSTVFMNQYSDPRYETNEFANYRELLREEAGNLIMIPPSSGRIIQMLDMAIEGNHSVLIHDNNMQASSSNCGSVQKQMFWDAAALDGAKRAGAKITNFQAQDYNPLNPSQIMVSTSPSLLRQDKINIAKSLEND